MLKKVISLATVCCMLLAVPLPTFATSKQEPIFPYLMYINLASVSLDISSGTATATSRIVGFNYLTPKVVVFMYLEQYVNESWQVIKNWSQAEKSWNTTLREIYAVSKGGKYRLKASCYAYSGAERENMIIYSPEVWA